ncbi:MAG: zinc-ribbon domain-containing protein [Candidatus Tectomicrobia bacterium]|nr:zinc-ribbon domain-containing protein [Candidatus Tectomicrobia bacterium]
MIPFIIGLMTAGALAAVIYPFMRKEGAPRAEETEWRLKELLAAKDNVYRTLKELDFDRLAGKLSEADFQQLEAQYRERAIQILRDIDALAGERGEARDFDGEFSEALEKEVLALRKAAQASREAAREPQAPAPPVRDARDAPPEPRFCRSCGVPVSSTDNFCSSCGTPLRDQPRKGNA